MWLHIVLNYIPTWPDSKVNCISEVFKYFEFEEISRNFIPYDCHRNIFIVMTIVKRPFQWGVSYLVWNTENKKDDVVCCMSCA